MLTLKTNQSMKLGSKSIPWAVELSQTRDLGLYVAFQIQCYIFMTFNLSIINLGTIKNKTAYSVQEYKLQQF